MKQKKIEIQSINREVLLLVDSIAHEKNVDKEMVFEALEQSIAFAARKNLKGSPNLRVEINKETGFYKVYRKWEVVKNWEDDFNDDTHLMTVDLEDHHPKNVSSFEEEIFVDLGRNAAKLVKQGILQKLKEIEQIAGLNEMDSNDLVLATVKGFAKGNAILEIGQVEAILPRNEQLYQDRLTLNAKILVDIKKVEKVGVKTIVTASRVTPEFMEKLLLREINALNRGDAEIVKLVRNPGFRTKILVKSNRINEFSRSDLRSDVVGIILGKKSINLSGVTKETGEFVDVYEWKESITDLVLAVFDRIPMKKVIFDESLNEMTLVLEKSDDIQRVIGHKETNIKMLSELIGVNLKALTEDSFNTVEQEHNEVKSKIVQKMMKELDIDEELAEELVDCDIKKFEDFECDGVKDLLLEIGLDHDVSNEIIRRAKVAFDSEQSELIKQHKESLNKINGVSEVEVDLLLKAGYKSWNDCADLAWDELIEAIPEFDEERAKELVIAARQNW